MDVKEVFVQIEELIANFFKLEKDDPKFGSLDLSWGYKGQSFETSDPFGRVRAIDNRIILKELDIHDSILILDMTKGAVNYHLPISLKDTYSGWNFATLVSLVILPSTLIDAGTKTKYRKEWLDFKQIFTGRFHRYHYDRWSDIFLAFPRVTAIEILQSFILNIYCEGSDVEDQLNNYLFDAVQAEYSDQDLEVMMTGLKSQTLDVKQLGQLLPDYSETTLYRIIRRLALHLGQYYVPSYQLMNLHRLFLLGFIEGAEDILRKSKYFESNEDFHDGTEYSRFIKFWMPTDKIGAIIESVSGKLQASNKILVSNPQIIEAYLCPTMFNAETMTWNSVFQEQRDPVHIRQETPEVDFKLERNDLKILNLMLRMQTNDYRKLSVELSKNTTKSIVRKLEKYKIFDQIVMWRRPANLPTAAVILPISKPQKFAQTATTVTTITQLDDGFDKTELLNQIVLESILKYSWPAITRDSCYMININQANELQFQKIILLRISGLQSDVEQLLATHVELELIGWHKNSPGTLTLYLEDMDNNGKWVYDLEPWNKMLVAK